MYAISTHLGQERRVSSIDLMKRIRVFYVLLETEYKGETTVIMPVTKGFGCLTERQLVI